MKLKRIAIFILIISLLGMFAVYYDDIKNATGLTGSTVENYYLKEQAVLLRVVDGDTIEAQVEGYDETWKIRMLGINTPEKNMPFSDESKAFIKQFEGKNIILERDKEDTDKYNRKLRYVFYDNRFLDKEILENGFANSYYTAGLRYENELLEAEKTARQNEIGIWTKSNERCSGCILLKKLDAIEEYFILKNDCTFLCSLDGWFVKDAGRNTFYLTSLLPGEEKTYNSNNKEIWNNDGDRLFMFDKNGLLALFYEY